MRYLIVMLVLCFGGISFAGDKVCVNNYQTKCSQPMKAGDVAQFDGQLLTSDLAIDLAQKANDFNARLNIEMERIKKLDQLDLDLEKKLHSLDNQAWVQEKDLMMKDLKKLENPISWYEKPLFVAIVTGVAVGFLAYGMFRVSK